MPPRPQSRRASSTGTSRVTGCIYELTFAGGDSYVGYSVNLAKRLNSHRHAARTGSPLWVHERWRRWGEPECTILEDGIPAAELGDRERHWICERRLTRDGADLNMTDGGDKPPRLDELPQIEQLKVRARKSAAGKRYAATPEGREQLLIALEKATAPAARKKQAAKMKRYAATPKGRAHIEAMRAAARTPAARKKHAVALKRYAATPEGKANHLAAGNTQKAPESRARRSAAMKKLWESPEFRARRSAAMKRYAATPEGRAQLEAAGRAGRARMKKLWESPEFRAGLCERALKGHATRRRNRELRQKMRELGLASAEKRRRALNVLRFGCHSGGERWG